MLPGDRIIGVDGVDLSDAPIETIHSAITVEGPVTLTILRDGQTVELHMKPVWDAEMKMYRVGITFRQERRAAPFLAAVQAGWEYCAEAAGLIVTTLGEMLQGQHLDEVNGPVGAVAMVSQVVREDGFTAFVSMLTVISVNLGVMNLLPIPGLDGSRLLFMAVEAVRGKPVAPEKEAVVHLIGMLFLFTLMIFFTFRDVLRLFQ